jgi:uncharacterized membrane protein
MQFRLGMPESIPRLFVNHAEEKNNESLVIQLKKPSSVLLTSTQRAFSGFLTLPATSNRG